MKKIAFIAKTNLNTDGRILNELKIFEEYYPGETIDFILLPDKKTNISLSNVRLHTINCLIRNSAFFRPLAVLEFTIRALLKLIRLSPQIVHIQDSAVIFPVYLYKLIRGTSLILIYDDHEIPNSFDAKGLYGLFLKLEEKILKKSNMVIFANEERLEFLKHKYRLSNNLTFFLNLPYYEEEQPRNVLPETVNKHLVNIDKIIDDGVRFIMHQGVINDARGKEKLSKLVSILPPRYRILLLGGNVSGFQSFVKEFDLDEAKFYFVGTVDYHYLPEFWNRCLASIVMYSPTYLNNRLCAPNRFYISIQKEIPVIVNKDNPVLANFINRYNCGYFIEDFSSDSISLIEKYDKNNIDFSYSTIRQEQIVSFLTNYNNYLS